MFSRLFSFLLLSWVLALPLQASQGVEVLFHLEDGSVIDPLQSGLVLDDASTGYLAVTFPFVSHLRDITTGLFIRPDLHDCYSIRLVGDDPESRGDTWIHGGPFLGHAPRILSFDEQSGAGRATAYLPLHQVTREATWGRLFEGSNEITLYWGSAGQVDHDGIHPPSMPGGRESFRIEAIGQEIEVGFAQNRDLAVGDTVPVYVFVKQTANEDRNFGLSVSPPGSVDLPATLVVPAGKQIAYVFGTVLQAEDVRITAVSPRFPGRSFSSSLGVFGWRRFRVVEGDGAMGTSPGSTFLARCVEGEETTPSGQDPKDSKSQEEICGGCKWAPSVDDCAPPASGGLAGFVWDTSCKPAFSSCHPDSAMKDIQLTVWELVSSREESCAGIPLPLTDLEISLLSRYCCTYKPRPDLPKWTVSVKKCQP